MHSGKETSELLKSIRLKLAEANGITYEPNECKHEAPCEGTCPLCDQELRWLDRQLRYKMLRNENVIFDVLTEDELDLFFDSLDTVEEFEPADPDLEGMPRLMGDIPDLDFKPRECVYGPPFPDFEEEKE